MAEEKQAIEPEPTMMVSEEIYMTSGVHIGTRQKTADIKEDRNSYQGRIGEVLDSLEAGNSNANSISFNLDSIHFTAQQQRFRLKINQY